MTAAYVDTNVIVSKYLPQDPFHDRSKSFLDSGKGRKIVSPLTVVELMAVTSRQAETLQAPEEILKEEPRRRIRGIVEFFLRDSNLTPISVEANTRMKVAGSIVTVPLEYVSSLKLAHSLRLRTLDLMHLAYADNIRSSGEELDSFVTTDRGILKVSDTIEKILKMRTEEPA
jgi:predicted nucleic acid-binding protein